MKKAKKILALLLCAVLLVCATVAGTLAYLKANTTTVTNTFVAAGGPGPFVDPDITTEDKDDVMFAIKEYKVIQSSTGKYTKTTEEVTENSYDVMPGTTIPKQAFVKLSRTATRTETTDGETTSVKEIAPAPAYLYLEVIDGLPEAYSWEIDNSNWTILNGLKGVNNGDVYLYTGSLADANHVITKIAAYNANMIDIIKDDKVTVAADATLTADAVTLSFNAYLAQASTGETDDPAAVFAACFKPATTPEPENP